MALPDQDLCGVIGAGARPTGALHRSRTQPLPFGSTDHDLAAGSLRYRHRAGQHVVPWARPDLFRRLAHNHPAARHLHAAVPLQDFMVL